MTKYVPTIGIECHVQLKTATKLFSAVNNDARDLEPNVAVSQIDFGLPGVLPVLNEAVLDIAIRAGTALNAKVNQVSKFDRKHYFYPDLPKGYQITQLDFPTVGRGGIDVPLGDSHFHVGITRAHLEEDAGKLVHHPSQPISLVDLNRAGTPLLEIVSEPDMHSAIEARAFAEELHRLMRYADVTYGDLYHGNMRFDVNISIAQEGSTELGTRAEIKNLNSFRSVERAVLYEIERQSAVLDDGGVVIQETRGWSDDKEETFSQRSKEDAQDYRYFPEPDVPPVLLDADRIQAVAQTVSLLPAAVRARLESVEVDSSVKEVITDEPILARLFMNATEDATEKAMKQIALWISGELATVDSIEAIENVTSEHLQDLEKMYAAEELSSTGVKKILTAITKDASKGSKEYAELLGVIQQNDEGFLEEIADQVLAENPQAVEDIQAGNEKAIGFLVGQVMKLSKGQANPGKANAILKKKMGV